jgi:hypothetical protein
VRRCLLHAADDVAQPDRRPKARSHALRQLIVAPLEPEDAIVARHPARRELIDERYQREILRIGEEEPAKPAHPGAEPLVDILRGHPSGDRLLRERRGDGGVPAPASQVVVLDFPRQPPCGILEGSAFAAERAAALIVRAVESPAAAQDPHGGQAEIRGEVPDVLLLSLDEVPASLRVLSAGEPVPSRHDAPAHAIARLHDRHLGAVRLQIARRDEACEAGSKHDDSAAGDASTPHHRSIHARRR